MFTKRNLEAFQNDFKECIKVLEEKYNAEILLEMDSYYPYEFSATLTGYAKKTKNVDDSYAARFLEDIPYKGYSADALKRTIIVDDNAYIFVGIDPNADDTAVLYTKAKNSIHKIRCPISVIEDQLY